MIPLKDNIPSRSHPWVNWVIIISCTVVFVLQLRGGAEGGNRLIERYGMIPARVLSPGEEIIITEQVPVQTFYGVQLAERSHEAEVPPFAPWLTLLTCIFLHGSLMHLLGNMWFLFIFGDNIEDRLGHIGYVFFYLAGGLAASVIHLLINMNSTVPTIGASGAIAAVMGGYFLLYPRAQVLTAVPIFFFIELLALPAPLFLGLWFFIQFIGGFQAIGGPAEAAGVAWWAHIGGFVAGLAVIIFLRITGLLRPPAGPPLKYHHHRAGRR